MDYKLHEMKKGTKREAQIGAHREPGGKVFVVIKCGGLGNLSMTSKQNTQNKQKQPSY
jgi:hypothetical protein